MIQVEQLFKEKKFPNWFTEHPIFKEVKSIKKVFPGIGLPNCEEEASVMGAKGAAQGLLTKINANVNRRIEGLNKFISSKPDMTAGRKAKSVKALTMLNSLKDLLSDSEKFITEHNGKLAIKLPADIILPGEVRPIFRKDETVFRIYNKINDELTKGHFAKLTKLEDCNAFKQFSSENIPNNKLKIVFAADKSDGAWDIATMSMRGVSSCQSWGGDYSHCTIGSVIDPFVGIIYLTSGGKFNDKGSRMIRRCIVRFVIDGENNKPYLLLDNMYPSPDQKVVEQFISFLKSKTGGKFEVHYAPTMNHDKRQHTYIPLNDVRKLLKQTSAHGDEELNEDLGDLSSLSSYQDVRIVDKESNRNDTHAGLFEKNATKKARKFLTEFDKAFVEAVKNVDVEKVPENVRVIVKKMQGAKGPGKLDKRYFNYSYVVPQFSHAIGNAFVKSVDKTSFTNSDLFARRIYQSYFNNKNKIFNDVKIKLTREMNGKLELKEKEKIRSEQFLSLMKVLMPSIDDIMKAKLKDIISKHKIYKQIPLPS